MAFKELAFKELAFEKLAFEELAFEELVFEELVFKDCKSNGWNWQRSHVWEPEHANRLWLVMALAYVWVIGLGARVQDDRQLLAELTRGTGPPNSLFNLGLRYFQRWVSLVLQLQILAEVSEA